LFDGNLPDLELRYPSSATLATISAKYPLLLMNNFSNFVIFFLCGSTATFFCLSAKKTTGYLGLVDVPNERKLHSSATPLIGGIVLLCAVLPTALVYILNGSSERWETTLLIWVIVTSTLTIIGIADDKHSLSPRSRILIASVAFGLAAGVDPTFNVRVLDFGLAGFTLGLGTWWLAIVFTIVCLVGLVNAVNMADGKNGLVLGLCLAWLAVLMARAPDALIPILLLLVTACAVILVFNLRGLVFLGDGGVYGLAAGIGLLSIAIYNSPGTVAVRSVFADELMLIFAVPVIDSFRLTFKRMQQGRSPMSGDRDHLHHHLQNKFGWPGGLVIYLIVALLPIALLLLLARANN
jgi:UDP-GlcNAc:undecaprenyl-phosphate/decaprenyl-phosphate GlcNAc-1-phosphate transferase